MSELGRDHDERGVLQRLRQHRTIYIACPDRARAALRLQERGLVTTRLGEGKDAGLLLVSAAVRRPRLVDGGGAA